ncbi:hypothetical protein FB451DRAFT_1267942 [Mycena latifolia]|nr:hypothetical protein FB451DRAFT_1267942 [Mycena latifolia]
MAALAPELITLILNAILDKVDDEASLRDNDAVSLADEADASLRACALTSKIFRVPAQCLLFRRMTFPVEHNFRGGGCPAMERVRRATDILSSSPHLIASVRQLHIGSMYWKEGWAAMEVFLRILKPARIERFSMEGAVNAMPANVRVALADLFAQPSMQNVKFWSWDSVSPAIVAAAFAFCRKVYIRSYLLETQTAVHADSSTSEQEPHGEFLLAIENGGDVMEHLVMLTPHNSGDFLLNPALSRFITHLREMEIYADGLEALHLCSDTLTHLKIHEIGDIESPEFPRLGALRVLTLANLKRVVDWAALQFCAASLPDSLPALEVLNLDVYVIGDDAPKQETFCPEVDAALAALASLREINCVVRDPDRNWNESNMMRYQEGVEKVLPSAHRAGLLTFSQTYESSTD